MGNCGSNNKDPWAKIRRYLEPSSVIETDKGWDLYKKSVDQEFKDANDLAEFLKYYRTGIKPEGISGDKQSFYDLLHEKRLKTINTNKALEIKDEQRRKEIVVGKSPSQSGFQFVNWGETVNEPVNVFYPYDSASIVKFMKDNLSNPNFKVRASGFRHSWSNIFPDPNTYLISILPEYVASGKSGTLQKYLNTLTTPGSDFYVIKVVGNPDPEHAYVKLGGGVTNEQVRQWSQDLQNPYMPLNVIMTEITFTGSNGTMSHGAGIKHPTLSDLVYEIEFVNAKGNIQVVNRDKNPDVIDTAAGALGFLGIVISLTLKLNTQKRYAQINPLIQPMVNAIPEVKSTYTMQNQQDIQAFNDIILNKYYCEWFWFMGKNDEVFVNAWDTVEKPDPNIFQKQFPKTLKADLEMMESNIAEIMSDMIEGTIINNRWVREFGTKIFGALAMRTLPHDRVDTLVSEALHFQRGIQNYRVRDLEVEIAIPIYDGQLDLELARKAWWAAKNYSDSDNKDGINLTIEMRIFGTSKVTMAPEYGYPATCSIEILSNMLLPERVWNQTMNKMWALWKNLKDCKGNPVVIRPHWGKEWENIVNPDGSKIMTTLKQSYKNQITKFKKDIDAIGQLPQSSEEKWTLADSRKRFSNKLLDSLLFD
jgi:hypothetical protein